MKKASCIKYHALYCPYYNRHRRCPRNCTELLTGGYVWYQSAWPLWYKDQG